MPKKTKEPRLSTPMPARVWEDDEIRSIGVVTEKGPLEVVSIDDRVEEEGAFWEPEPVYKMRYRVTLEDGRELGIFRHYKTGSWYRRG